MEGAHAKESLSCSGCLNDIGDDDYVCALAQNWHKECFRCSVCDAALTSWYFEKTGLLFCREDYWARFGENCQQCGQVMTGPVMAAGDHRFHPECFACVACAAPIEDGQPYALLNRSDLYCGPCSGAHECRSTHAIRVLRVPAARLRLAPRRTALTLSQACSVLVCRCGQKLSRAARALLRALLPVCLHLCCYRIDSSCGLLALHIGDRILEINGTPVKNTPIEEIEKVLARPDAVIQLTIEHNPEPTNNNTVTKPPTPTTLTDVEEKPKLDTKSPVERKILREDLKKQIAEQRERDADDDVGAKKERLFKRKGEEGSKRLMKRKQTPNSPLLGDKERSSSMSKLLDAVEGGEKGECGVLQELSRARSFRGAQPNPPLSTVFRAADLLQGELLGSGFFGEVYKVTHRDTNEVMVLKQLYRVDDDAQRNFLKEVAVLRSLNHPNVLRFIGVLYKDKRLHLITEYVPGGTLHQLLQDVETPLSWEVRARLARDVAAGVGYLHRRQVIHRDLNTHNCLVRQDKTVIVADFGLARIVQRTPCGIRKRYTVVGNPYWMAPEMMNGNVYDEKVDVFSFGIILCEIIGRVSADPDYLPRRADFGVNETAFSELYGRACPPALRALAFRAARPAPDTRPSFEMMEGWLDRLVVHLSGAREDRSLLADILRHDSCSRCSRYRTSCTCRTCEECSAACRCDLSHEDSGPAPYAECPVVKCKSSAALCVPAAGPARALDKCVSAGHLAGGLAPGGLAPGGLAPGRLAAGGPLTPGYILRARGHNIDITKVADISSWVSCAGQKRACIPGGGRAKSRRLRAPAFLRNQSAGDLARDRPHLHRHCSEPHHPQRDEMDSDSSSDDEVTPWSANMDIDLPKIYVDPSATASCDVTPTPRTPTSYDVTPTSRTPTSYDVTPTPRTPTSYDVTPTPRTPTSYDVTPTPRTPTSYDVIPTPRTPTSYDVTPTPRTPTSYDVTPTPPASVAAPDPVVLRNPNERKIPEVDYRRFNIDELTKSPIMAEGLKNINKVVEQQKQPEKSGFFTKKLLSPKLSRLFKPNTNEVNRNKSEPEESKEEKSRSKFFVQRPASPGNLSRGKIRPLPEEKPPNVLKTDLKLASLGKPMTPIFRRHAPTEKPEFADGRFSYRDRLRTGEKIVDIGRNRKKDKVSLPPLIRCSPTSNIPALATVLEKRKIVSQPSDPEKGKTEKDGKKREGGISRSNYVSLANLRINGKPVIPPTAGTAVPAERVI